MIKKLKNRFNTIVLLNSIFWTAALILIVTLSNDDIINEKIDLKIKDQISKNRADVSEVKNIIETTLSYENKINKKILDEIHQFIENKGGLRLSKLKNDKFGNIIKRDLFLSSKKIPLTNNNEVYLPIIDDFSKQDQRIVLIWTYQEDKNILNPYPQAYKNREGNRVTNSELRNADFLGDSTFVSKRILQGMIYEGFNFNYEENEIYYGRYEALKNNKGEIIGIVFCGDNINNFTNLKNTLKNKQNLQMLTTDAKYTSNIFDFSSDIIERFFKKSAGSLIDIDKNLIKKNDIVSDYKRNEVDSLDQTIYHTYAYSYIKEIDRIILSSNKITSIDNTLKYLEKNFLNIVYIIISALIFSIITTFVLRRKPLNELKEYFILLINARSISDIEEAHKNKNYESEYVRLSIENLMILISENDNELKENRKFKVQINELLSSEKERVSQLESNCILRVSNLKSFYKELSNENEELNDINSKIVSNFYNAKNYKSEMKNELENKIILLNNKYLKQLDNIKTLFENNANNPDKIIKKLRLSESLKLLYYNLEIEAEKAGKHGKGFHFIAKELKELSDRTFEMEEKVISYNTKKYDDVVQKIDELKNNIDNSDKNPMINENDSEAYFKEISIIKEKILDLTNKNKEKIKYLGVLVNKIKEDSKDITDLKNILMEIEKNQRDEE